MLIVFSVSTYWLALECLLLQSTSHVVELYAHCRVWDVYLILHATFWCVDTKFWSFWIAGCAKIPGTVRTDKIQGSSRVGCRIPAGSSTNSRDCCQIPGPFLFMLPMMLLMLISFLSAVQLPPSYSFLTSRPFFRLNCLTYEVCLPYKFSTKGLFKSGLRYFFYNVKLLVVIISWKYYWVRTKKCTPTKTYYLLSHIQLICS